MVFADISVVFPRWNHSHKKRKDSLETWAELIDFLSVSYDHGEIAVHYSTPVTSIIAMPLIQIKFNHFISCQPLKLSILCRRVGILLIQFIMVEYLEYSVNRKIDDHENPCPNFDKEKIMSLLSLWWINRQPIINVFPWHKGLQTSILVCISCYYWWLPVVNISWLDT